jgi:manganese transport protein
VLAWLVAAIIVALNGKLVGEQVVKWAQDAGSHGWLVYAAFVPLALGLAGLLLWLTLAPEKAPAAAAATATADEVFATAAGSLRTVKRIGVALEAVNADAPMLADAIALARVHSAELVLIHVVEGVGGQWYGQQAGDAEQRLDDEYLCELADRLRAEGLPAVWTVLGYGNVQQQIVEIARKENLDLLVVGGHGHRGLMDVFRGQTIDTVRHGLSIPILAIRGKK